MIDLSKVPTTPGVYLWKDNKDQVIYVGKAKNLKSRMKQYFSDDVSPKTRLLIRNIASFSFQEASSEMEALILEQKLINEYEPKFNIKIKSSKTYPYIELKIGEVIKLSVSKTLKFNKGSKYYGPFPDGFNARRIINLLSLVFPIDDCLSPKSGKACLNYEMNRCMGQCINLNIDNHKKMISEQIEDFFKGKVGFVENSLKDKLNQYNENLQFEESKKVFEYIELISKIKEQSVLAFKDTKHRDIIDFYVKDGVISISIKHIRFGQVGITVNQIFKLIDPDPLQAIQTFIGDHYKNNIIPDELILSFEPNWDLNLNTIITVPKTGTKFDLLKLTSQDAKSNYIKDIDAFLLKAEQYDTALVLIKDKTNLKTINTIEMVDISSTKGEDQVGVVIQFYNGEPRKTAYRKYIIKTVKGMDDYASTEEVVNRHFKRILEENRELPDVFIVDGKNQLNNAKMALFELNIAHTKVLALKKNSKHKTEGIIDSEMNEHILDPKSNAYLFLARMQEEVHRFAITFHRSRRDKTIIESELDKYEFLTENDKRNLFKEFNSIRNIKLASETELSKVISKTKSAKMKGKYN